jgi:hypothetical protein
MKSSRIVIAAVAAIAIAGSAGAASAAVILEGGHFTSETGTDFNTLLVQNNNNTDYADVMINGVDVGPLAKGATTPEVSVGDPTEVSGSPVELSILLPGQVRPHVTTQTAFDLDANGQFFLGNQAVPEPATWAMMLVGLGGLGGLMRRRARALAA